MEEEMPTLSSPRPSLAAGAMGREPPPRTPQPLFPFFFFFSLYSLRFIFPQYNSERQRGMNYSLTPNCLCIQPGLGQSPRVECICVQNWARVNRNQFGGFGVGGAFGGWGAARGPGARGEASGAGREVSGEEGMCPLAKLPRSWAGLGGAASGAGGSRGVGRGCCWPSPGPGWWVRVLRASWGAVGSEPWSGLCPSLPARGPPPPSPGIAEGQLVPPGRKGGKIPFFSQFLLFLDAALA